MNHVETSFFHFLLFSFLFPTCLVKTLPTTQTKEKKMSKIKILLTVLLVQVFSGSTNASSPQKESLQLEHKGNRCETARNKNSYKCNYWAHMGTLYPTINIASDLNFLYGEWNLRLLAAPSSYGNSVSENDNHLFETIFHYYDHWEPAYVAWKPESGRIGRLGPARISLGTDGHTRLDLDSGLTLDWGGNYSYSFRLTHTKVDSARNTTAVFQNASRDARLECRSYIMDSDEVLSCSWFEHLSGAFLGIFRFHR
jgi:hypothetical protein